MVCWRDVTLTARTKTRLATLVVVAAAASGPPQVYHTDLRARVQAAARAGDSALESGIGLPSARVTGQAATRTSESHAGVIRTPAIHVVLDVLGLAAGGAHGSLSLALIAESAGRSPPPIFSNR